MFPNYLILVPAAVVKTHTGTTELQVAENVAKCLKYAPERAGVEEEINQMQIKPTSPFSLFDSSENSPESGKFCLLKISKTWPRYNQNVLMIDVL